MFVWVALAAVLIVPDQGRQGDFAAAAREFGVPESVLLGVSYLHSRWDAHAGLPSTAGGYGPMHLVGMPPDGHPHGAARAGGTGGSSHGSTYGLPHEDPRTGMHGDLDGGSHEDARGDAARPVPRLAPPAESAEAAKAPVGATLRAAGRLTGLSAARLRSDPAANIRAGAALLASYQRRPSADPARWHGAIARYAGSSAFADEVLSVLRTGAARRTDDGSLVRLAPVPGLRPPAGKPGGTAECPRSLACEWMPAAYARTGKGGYGNHDRLDRTRRIDTIVVHDTEGSYRGIAALVRNPRYVSWHYTIRSADGHVAQHVLGKDIAWHAGNWDVNSRSIGIEHEGYLAKGGTWYTEAMYRASARLVRYLADRYDIPLDRAHILGHDNVPGTSPTTLPEMHEDPGPYWDWAHYFDLLGAPFGQPEAVSDDLPRTLSRKASVKLPKESSGKPPGQASPAGSGRDSVLIRPAYDDHRPHYTGCATTKPTRSCPAHGASAVWLRTAPRDDAPLVDDLGKRVGQPSTYSVYDHSARASTGQRFGVAERRGAWTAIWYLGQKAWLHNPAARPTAVRAAGPLVTPVRAGVQVYGVAYPGKAAYQGTGASHQRRTPLGYTIGPGQTYALGQTLTGTYHAAGSFNPAKHVTITGDVRYHQIQLGHRVAFVRARDVRVIR